MTSQVLPDSVRSEEARSLVGIGFLLLALEQLPEGTPFPRDDEEVLAITGADRAAAYAVADRLEAIVPELYDLIVNHGAFETPEGFDAFRRRVLEAGSA